MSIQITTSSGWGEAQVLLKVERDNLTPVALVGFVTTCLSALDCLDVGSIRRTSSSAQDRSRR